MQEHVGAIYFGLKSEDEMKAVNGLECPINVNGPVAVSPPACSSFHFFCCVKHTGVQGTGN